MFLFFSVLSYIDSCVVGVMMMLVLILVIFSFFGDVFFCLMMCVMKLDVLCMMWL